MHVETDVLVADDGGLASVQPDANPDRFVVRPCVDDKLALCLRGRATCVQRTLEYAEGRIALAVSRERDGEGIFAGAVDKMSERLDPVICDSVVTIDYDHTCEIRPLVPELRTMARLVQEERHDLTRLQAPATERVAKSRLGKMRREYPRVVAIALPRA